MIKKMNHVYSFMLNAEHHCRFTKYPFRGFPDDGLFHEFDDIFDGTKKKSGNSFLTKMRWIDTGFKRYFEMFYFKSEVFGTILILNKY